MNMFLSVVWPLVNHPFCFFIEGFFIAVAIWYIIHRKSRIETPKLTPEEEEEIINEWQPEPLVPPVDPDHYSLNPRVVSSMYGKMILVDGKQCLNLATHNYLGFVENEECIDAAVKAVKQYGVGSCGPRGFFGTVDVHLDLEQKIADFMGTEEAILYSYGYSAISSAIPAYSKVNDIIFVDEGVNFAIQQGLTASRSNIRFFKHNDVNDLARLLEEQHKVDLQHPKVAKSISRFLVVEGLYINYGDICPLKEIIELKRKYKVRLFIDDTCGFGVLGQTGRGIVEHTNCDMQDVDMIAASLEYACAAYGGFCTGTRFIVDHQRLSGLGYCFSASLPPLQAAFGLRAIGLIEKNPNTVLSLRDCCTMMADLLNSHVDLIQVDGDQISPIKHLRFAKSIETVLQMQQNRTGLAICDDNFKQTPRDLDTSRLEKVVDYAFEKGYALTMARYLDRMEHKLPKPSIRLTVSVLLTEKEITESVSMIVDAFTTVDKSFLADL